MDKQRLLQCVIETLTQREESTKQSLEITRQAAIDAPGAMQSHSDTTKWQMSQRAGAIGQSLCETQKGLGELKRLMSHLPSITRGSVYAIIEVDNLDDGSRAKYFLLPAGGGNTYEVEGEEITILNINAPLARVFIGSVAGDEVEIKIQGTTRRFNVVSVT
jgi:hypothetical protein